MTTRGASERDPSAFDWEQRALGDPEVSDIVMGQSPPSETYNTARLGLPFFQGKVDFGLRHPTPRLWCSRPAKVAQQNDILISVRAPVGDVNIASETCCIGRGLAAVRAGRLADPEFLFFLMMHHKPDLDGLGSGAIFKAINRDTLRSFEICIPRLPEQRAIASLLSKLQARVELQNCIVAVLKELKTATMTKLFREGLRGEPLKQTEIGEIPESWQVASLGDHCRITSGGTPSRDHPEYWGGHIPWVRTAEIDYGPIRNTDEFITGKGLENSSARLLPPGTLLMAMYGQGATRGRVAFLEIEATTNQACAALHPSGDLDANFLYAYLCLAYDRIRNLGHGANQQNLSGDLIRAVRLPLPPDSAEQRLIGTTIRSIDTRLFGAKAAAAVARSLFTATLAGLMTGQIRAR